MNELNYFLGSFLVVCEKNHKNTLFHLKKRRRRKKIKVLRNLNSIYSNALLQEYEYSKNPVEVFTLSSLGKIWNYREKKEKALSKKEKNKKVKS